MQAAPIGAAIFKLKTGTMKNMIKISTFAKRHNISTTYVYKLIKEGKLHCEIIDGVKFIKLAA